MSNSLIRKIADWAITIFGLISYFGILAFLFFLLYQKLPICFKMNGTLTVKKEMFISNGKQKVQYYIDDNGVKIDINSIHFNRPEYRDLSKIKDLNAVIYLSNDWKVNPDSIEILFSSICLQFQNKYQNTSKPSKEARIVLYSGSVPIGETTVKVEIKK